jgi:ATP-dependent DNA ligase
LLERRDWLWRYDDDLRRMLNFEPRGHGMMCSVQVMPPSKARSRLLAAIAKARLWLDELLSGKIASIAAIATREGRYAAGRATAAGLIAFDLLELDGKDWRNEIIEARREKLKRLIGPPTHALQFSDEIGGEGKDAWRAACNMGLEGIVSKRRGSVYRSGRNPNWRKTKCTIMDAFAVIGGKPARGSVRSLKIARLVSGGLTPCGWVGSGLTEREGIKIREAIDTERALIAEVEHRGLTPAGELRHPVLRGWRIA